MRRRPPWTTIRRLVRTSNGFVLLVVSNVMGRLAIGIHVYDGHGWEQPEKELSVEPGDEALGKIGGTRRRESLADAIVEALEIPLAEAEAIATETVGEWREHLSQRDVRKGREARRFVAALVAFAMAAPSCSASHMCSAASG